jgi:hypothetical protein
LRYLSWAWAGVKGPRTELDCADPEAVEEEEAVENGGVGLTVVVRAAELGRREILGRAL